MELNFFIFAGFGIWLLVVSTVTIWVFVFFRRLSKQVDKGNLIKVLGRVLDKGRRNEESIKKIRGEIKRIDKEGTFHFQKLGVIRFNPFDEMGGEHSFSLALLDSRDCGIVITGLHTREKTRVYVKYIQKGKSKVELSDEEKRALKQALQS
jgi:hypothetical protein